jgi:FGFR1 oncogene partner
LFISNPFFSQTSNEKNRAFGAAKTNERRQHTTMDDYTREMMDLKTLVTRTLEKKGVLAKIRAELRASVFEAIEEEDKAIEKDEGLPPALLGSCNDRAKQLHASPSGRLLTALICEYMDWAQLNHTLKVYTPECNLQPDAWKAELNDFSSKNGYDLNRNGDSGPLLLDVLEGFLKYENLSQARAGTGRRETESFSSSDSWSSRRPSSSSVAGGLPPLGRNIPVSHAPDRRGGSSGYRKDEYNWRYENDEVPEEVIRASSALENLQLDRKARNLTSSWRSSGDGTSDDDGRDHM